MVFILCESLSVSFENRSQQTLCCLGNEPINLFWNLFIWPNFIWYILILHGTRTQSIFSHLNPILTRTHAIYLRLNSILVSFQFSRSKINLVVLFYYRRLWIMFSAHHHQSLSIMPKSMSCLFVCFFWLLLSWNQYGFRCFSPRNRLIVRLLFFIKDCLKRSRL